MLERRNLLMMIGLAPAAAIGAEAFVKADADGPSIVAPSRATRESIAAALNNLAALVEKGDVDVTGVEVNSDLMPAEIMRHTVKIGLIFKA